MSQVKLSGNASGSGSVTIASPNTNSAYTITLPAATGTFLTTASAGTVLQVVNYQTGAVATGTTTIPLDDTIPQITEGTEVMTLAITPTSATSKLRIDVVINGAGSGANSWATALFQDSTANALAAANYNMAVNNVVSYSGFTHFMTSGTTSATTFRVRCGTVTAATFTFNGQSSARIFGGVIASSITITEIAA